MFIPIYLFIDVESSKDEFNSFFVQGIRAD